MKTLIAVLLLCSVPAWAAPSAVLVWTAPTTYADDTAIVGTLTYNLYQGTDCAVLTRVQSGLLSLGTTVLAGLTPGTSQCFAVTAVQAGLESTKSATVKAVIPLATPGAPSQITVVIH